MQFMGVCPHWTPLDFRGPVPTGILVGLSPLGFSWVCPHWIYSGLSLLGFRISRGLSPQDFQGPVPAVDYESSRGRDNHVMIM